MAFGDNEADREMIAAERDASPQRYEHYRRTSAELLHARIQQEEARQREQGGREEVEKKFDDDGRSPSVAGSTSTRQSYSRRPSQALRTTSTQVERDVLAYLERHPTAVQRIRHHRLQHSQTVGSSKSKTTEPLPDFGGNKPYPAPLPDREEYVVEFSGHDDPLHPQNWSVGKKIAITAAMTFISFNATLSSAIFSPASQAIEEEFNVGIEVATLGTSLFVLGYAFGPIVWAPMSELYGRRLPTLIAAFSLGIFLIGVAIAKDIQTVMICRFFAGWAGSGALTLCPSVSADIFNNKTRGLAVATFAATIINGPLLGPMIGGFITARPDLGWRWTMYLVAILSFGSAVIAFFVQEESYPPIVLVEKAAKLRRLTRNWGIHAKQEEVEVDFRELVSKNVLRPIKILFTEPIVFLVTLYMSVLYGILYLSLTAYDIVFAEIHGFPLGVAGLPYLGFAVGVTIGFVATIAINPMYVRQLEGNNNVPRPEWRLYLAMPAGIAFAIGLFWFGWTGQYQSVSYWAPLCAGIFLGFGIYNIFVHMLNYILDAYLMFAASAIGANTIMRSLFGAVFPLFAIYMFEGIGINWGMTFLGILATLCVPMPFLFYRFGRKIRAKSKFCPAIDIEQDKKRDEESGHGASDESDDKKED